MNSGIARSLVQDAQESGDKSPRSKGASPVSGLAAHPTRFANHSPTIAIGIARLWPSNEALWSTLPPERRECRPFLRMQSATLCRSFLAALTRNETSRLGAVGGASQRDSRVVSWG